MRSNLHLLVAPEVGIALLLSLLITGSFSAFAQKVESAAAEKYWELTGQHGQKETGPGALASAEQILAVAEKAFGVQSERYIYALGLKAAAHQAMGEYGRAEAVYLRQLQLTKEQWGAKSRETATVIDELAGFYATIRDYERAEDYLKQNLEVVDGLERPMDVDAANDLDSRKMQTLQRLADQHLRTGAFKAAEERFMESHELLRKLMGTNYWKFKPHSDLRLAQVHAAAKNYAKAEALQKGVLAELANQAKPSLPSISLAEYDLARLYTDMGRFTEAEPLYQRSIASLERSVRPNHPLVAGRLMGFARHYILSGSVEKAEAPLLRNLTIRQLDAGTNSAVTKFALQDLAVMEMERGRIDAALTYIRRAEVVSEHLLANLLEFTADRQRLAYQAVQKPYNMFASLGSALDLAQVLLRNKGIALDAYCEDQELAAASSDPRIKQLLALARSINASLTRSATNPENTRSGTTNTEEKNRQFLQEQAQTAQQELRRRLTRFGNTRKSLNLKVISAQAVLPTQAVILEFVRYDHYLGKLRWEPRYGVVLLGHPTVAFNGSNEGKPVWVPLGSASSIDRTLATYAEVVRGERPGDATVLQTLAKQLFDPIKGRLPRNIRTLIVSPDAGLNFVSFGTLLTGTGKFLGEEFNIRYVASGRDLRSLSSTSQIHGELVTFANPDFQLQGPSTSTSGRGSDANPLLRTDRRDLGGLKLSPLPGTRLEAEFLLTNFGKWRISGRQFSGPAATEAELNRVQSPYILHLATHGFFLPQTANNQARMGNPAMVEGGPDSAVFKNPMLRSGLALAGAQSTLEAWKRGEVPPTDNDGILTAQEVSGLNLQNTWLVVLSACDTGLGEARNGEGVLGLRRGFVQAGAQNLLMTLWPISDKWSVEIMKAFYEQAMASGDAPQAMADVQAEWLARLRKEKGALIAARIAGPFVLTSRGKPLTK